MSAVIREWDYLGDLFSWLFDVDYSQSYIFNPDKVWYASCFNVINAAVLTSSRCSLFIY